MCIFNERRSLEGCNYAHTHKTERNSALLTAGSQSIACFAQNKGDRFLHEPKMQPHGVFVQFCWVVRFLCCCLFRLYI